MTFKAHHKTSLKTKSSEELSLLRISLLKDFSSAKKMRTYGAMGHIAEKISLISSILNKRGVAVITHQKPSLLLVDVSIPDTIYPQKVAAY